MRLLLLSLALIGCGPKTPAPYEAVAADYYAAGIAEEEAVARLESKVDSLREMRRDVEIVGNPSMDTCKYAGDRLP